MASTGTTTLDFGAFPGKSDTSTAVTGQASIVAGSLVEAWIRPVATADHTADEHMVETLKVVAGNIVAGTGFTIYGFNTSQQNEPANPPRTSSTSVLPTSGLTDGPVGPGSLQSNFGGGKGTRLYGLYTVAWAWN
jgi:hypothetical protein